MGGRRGTRGVGTAHPLPVQPPPTIPPAARTTTQRNVFSSCDSINTAVEERCRSDPRGEELEGHGCLERRPAGFMWCAMLIYHFLPSAYHRLLGGWVYANCFHSFPSIPSLKFRKENPNNFCPSFSDPCNHYSLLSMTKTQTLSSDVYMNCIA